MQKTELEQAIRTAQNHPYQVVVNTDNQEFRAAIEEFGKAAGMGNQWIIEVDGIIYSVRYTDGDYTARELKKKKSTPFPAKLATTPDGDFDTNGNLR